MAYTCTVQTNVSGFNRFAYFLCRAISTHGYPEICRTNHHCWNVGLYQSGNSLQSATHGRSISADRPTSGIAAGSGNGVAGTDLVYSGIGWRTVSDVSTVPVSNSGGWALGDSCLPAGLLGESAGSGGGKDRIIAYLGQWLL